VELEVMLLVLVMRTYRNRGLPDFSGVQVQAIEYFAGEAAVTREHLSLGFSASRFDVEYYQRHDCLAEAGQSLWLDELAYSSAGSLQWFGTQCSSWVVMCRGQSRRSSLNGYWGAFLHPRLRPLFARKVV
jgi:hypothetical protein